MDNKEQTTPLLRELIKQDLIKRPAWSKEIVMIWMLAVTLIASGIFNGFLHYQNNKTITELLEINKNLVKSMRQMQFDSDCEQPAPEQKKEEMVVWR